MIFISLCLNLGSAFDARLGLLLASMLVSCLIRSHLKALVVEPLFLCLTLVFLLHVIRNEENLPHLFPLGSRCSFILHGLDLNVLCIALSRFIVSLVRFPPHFLSRDLLSYTISFAL